MSAKIYNFEKYRRKLRPDFIKPTVQVDIVNETELSCDNGDPRRALFMAKIAEIEAKRKNRDK